ncbi:THAP domain-containing protein 6 [Gopherus flavomarginatus]|uniref:THAP domain-containing protein 6 n=1 Tax=Gopherus flavomarginatus TaxID=286002 RepID=UPI0021CBC749|nr:THAP domain-containing protein 6 [Gopherus flavomarginatus]XP_050801033.1 THAP domain-containing protein 6 [Gopherus flavomarginatus]
MVKSCAAIGCASRCLPNSKLRGLTFHVFPTDEEAKRRWVLATKRLDVNSAGMWEPKKTDVLCSRHFKKSDFDTRGPNIRLKPGVIPSIFELPSHFQRRRGKVHGRRNTPLKTLPVTVHNHQLVDSPSSTGEFHSQFILEHSYSIMDSPKKLKCKLDQVISELEEAKEHLRNTLDRERQRRESLRTVIRELENKCLISPETACKLDVYCWEWCEAGTQEKTIN